MMNQYHTIDCLNLIQNPQEICSFIPQIYLIGGKATLQGKNCKESKRYAFYSTNTSQEYIL